MAKENDLIFKRFLDKHPLWQQESCELDSLATLINEYCKVNTYLEIGTAEGGSLYYLGHRLAPVRAVCVDLAEEHTKPIRDWVLEEMREAVDIALIAGNSTDPSIIDAVKAMGPFDVVFIDGGHDYATVRSDWMNYGPLAAKLCVFHDICLPDVKRVWDEIQRPKLSLVASGRFGMGLIFV